MDSVASFLKINGFKCVSENNYTNGLCNVIFRDPFGYEIIDNEGGRIYSSDNSIYWLIGVLTYYEYMNKNYKQ